MELRTSTREEATVFPTKNDLPAQKRDVMVKSLNQNLATLIDLRLQAKQAHWNVKGPHFIALHELFDKVVDVADGFVDEVAERLVALGGVAEGTLSPVSKASQLAPYPLDIAEGPAHVAALANAIAGAAKLARAGIDFADEHGDEVSADVYTEVARGLDQQLWFVEAHLQATR